ncbi:protease modulator HflC [bacterium]|nr:protease modulator HflC [bacterium]
MKKIVGILTFMLLLTLAYFSLFIVNESEYAIVTQFGHPVSIIETPGLYLKHPGFLQDIKRFDKRVEVAETQPIQLLLKDKNPVVLTTYFAWKVKKPLLFYQSIGTIENAAIKLNDMLNAQMGIIVGEYKLENLINTNTSMIKTAEINNRIKELTNSSSIENYGISIVSFAIDRITYPSTVTKAVEERMKSERQKEAAKIRAEGKEHADKLRADADREAKGIIATAEKEAAIVRGEGEKKALSIYSKAYSKEREFFDFTKSLEAYETILNSDTTLIISTDSELFKYLEKTKR